MLSNGERADTDKSHMPSDSPPTRNGAPGGFFFLASLNNLIQRLLPQIPFSGQEQADI